MAVPGIAPTETEIPMVPEAYKHTFKDDVVIEKMLNVLFVKQRDRILFMTWCFSEMDKLNSRCATKQGLKRKLLQYL